VVDERSNLSIKNPHKHANKKGHGRKISYYQEIEDKLLARVLEKHKVDGVAVATQLIRTMAQSLIKEHNSKFKVSEGCVVKFLRRNRLVLRMQTHISQNLPKDIEDRIEDKIEEFRVTVKHMCKNSDYPLEFICNIDETSLLLDSVPKRVVDRKMFMSGRWV